MGEPILNHFISYHDMKTNCPFEIIDLRHQSDHITPRKLNFQEFCANPNNARLFLILIRRREIELISGGNKFLEVKII